MHIRKAHILFTLNLVMLTLGDMSSLAGQPTTNIASVTDTDLETVRNRVITDLYQTAVDSEHVRDLLKNIKSDGSWPNINYTDVSPTGFEHYRHLENTYVLSIAYKKADSPWYGNVKAKNAALSALDYWLKRDFISDNWWWNEIGTPSRMIRVLLVLDTDLNDHQRRIGMRIAGRANLEAYGARPGGDRIKIAVILGRQALFRRDETVLKRVVSVMEEEITITTGRGLKPDMSFHHRVDNVISTLSHGIGFASAYANWAAMTADTRYSFPENTSRLLIDYFLDGICKSMVHGRYPDPGARDRSLSREGNLRPLDSDLPQILTRISAYRRQELEDIAAIRNGQLKPNLSWNRFFWHSEYLSHQRPGYFASVRMHSSRNHTTGQPYNGEGLKMHHLGDGANFISVTGREYFDIFAVWDWQKIPGTTVVQRPALPDRKEIAKKGLTDFVGAVSDGRYGAVTMDFKSAHDPLSARKGWFFFDDEFTCLGAGISSQATNPVVTTINQCRLNGDVVVNTWKQKKVLDEGKHSLNDVSWVWHNGLGYVFAGPMSVNISNTKVTGTWKSISLQAVTSDDTVAVDVFGLWIDHGIQPSNTYYEYTIVPASSPEELERYLQEPQVIVLENNESVQAVLHRGMRRVQIVFYQPGTIRVGETSVGASSPCVVMVKLNGKSVEELAVSDPSRKLETITLRVSALLEGADDWPAVWDKKQKENVINIDLPRDEYAGESVLLRVPLSQ